MSKEMHGHMRKSPSAEYIFNSQVAQRVKPGMLPGQEESTSNLVGPSTYNGFQATIGQPFVREWITEPKRKQSSFASKTEKNPLPRPLTADIDHGKDFGERGSRKTTGCGGAPGSRGLPWTQDLRKPPFFHIPFKAYPFEGGEPRGREPGLDKFYELDTVVASPLALTATMAINVERSQRKYSATFRSKLPARPITDARGGSGNLGPGSYTLHRRLRSSVQLTDPDRPSRWSIPYSGGKYRNVGLSHRDAFGDPMEMPTVPMAPLPSVSGSNWEDGDDEAPPMTPMSHQDRREARQRLYSSAKQHAKSAASERASARALSRAQSAPRLVDDNRRAWH